jgi:hypothetical protein
VSRECTNAESEAGIAYAKIKAVYPQKTSKDLASSTVEQLMNEPGIKEVLGTVKKVAEGSPEAFYRALQHYVDRSVIGQICTPGPEPASILDNEPILTCVL